MRLENVKMTLGK